MRRYFLLSILVFIHFTIFSQEVMNDTIESTNIYSVTVRAYDQNRSLVDVPAAINVVSKNDLNRYNNSSIVPALNATAGVRMEERSPGSYRLNIRGSSLRSPFGVRNVKVYYNNIIFTDPGGQTYLNQLGFYNFQSLEIIKGPGSSIYGSGTGGVLLINNDAGSRKQGVIIDQLIGSCGTSNTNINLVIGNENSRSMFNYQRQQSDGYRSHSAMRRDIFSWEAVHALSEKDQVSASFFYGDLYYQTPGALNIAEFNADPKMARPTVGFVRGASVMQAAIYQKTFLAGASYQHQFTDRWQTVTSLYGAFTRLNNPNLRNYSRSNDPHVGGRSVWSYNRKTGTGSLLWQVGGELQQGFSTVRIYNNRVGNPDTLRSDDEINNFTWFAFTQATLQINKWSVTAGISYNKQQLRITHLTPLPLKINEQTFNNKLAPRLAILYKLKNNLSLYSSVSRGFSPPTTAELYPTGSIANPDLSAEEGWNYDVGVKGSLFTPKLFVDVNAFYFRLQNTIVQRRDIAGGDFFANAGSTRQRGIETQLTYQLFQANEVFKLSRLWMNYTYYHFRYKDFKQVSSDFSGNKLPGVTPHAISSGLDLNLKAGFYTNLTYQFIDKMPLNDANTAMADAYHLVIARLGYRTSIRSKISLDIFAGAENLLDEKYSLGNDINGFGGRYFNAAAGRNYFAGISFGFLK